MNRRDLLGTAVAGMVPMMCKSQALVQVKLMVVRRMGLTPTNQCVAPCIRGSIYDLSDQAGPLDQTIVSLLKTRQPICDVIERPWKGNQANVSSVPKGIYDATIRQDRTKPWMSNENRAWRLELKGTQPRQAIQFHYGQDVDWSQGCFILGALLQQGDAAGITARYCRVEDGEAAVAAIRSAVMAPGRDIQRIKIGVTDESGLFPGLQPSAPC